MKWICKTRSKGVTLIEVIAVIIIVGILAAIAVPMVRNHIRKAILTEAVIGLGILRTSQMMYARSHGGSYQGGFTVGSETSPGSGMYNYPYGVTAGQLDGTFFSEGCYTVEGNPVFLAVCYVSKPKMQNAPKGQYAYDMLSPTGVFGNVVIDESGQIWTWNIPNSGYEEFIPPS